MSRNVNSFFSENPVTMDMSRSKFERNQNVKTTLDAGKLVPFYIDEVLPGDSMSIDTSQVIRMSTLIAPIMDNIYCDTYYFFVPNRLVWEHWKEFMGENTQSAWIPSVSYSIPQLYTGQTGLFEGSIADYFGLPTKTAFSVSALPFRAYGLIYNEWFRDENLTNPLYVPVNDSNQGASIVSVNGGYPELSSKYHDYFTSCLPAPQKGPDVPLPLGNVAPVIPGGSIPLSYFPFTNGTQVTQRNGANISANPHNLVFGAPSSDNKSYLNYDQANYTGTISNDDQVVFANLWTDLGAATGTSINQLREAFQVQKLYEKDALGGTRYTEIIKAHFGVSSPDARLQRPEYLGGCRVPINIHQVVQNSATDSVSPQGNTAAYSLTINTHSDFTKSFTEHGMIIGLMCIRYKHSYQQGIERFWSRKLREDFYFPVFANLGNQAVLNKEIYATGTSTDNEVFGYQEAWAEYRYKPDRISGQFRSNATGTLDFWHLGDNYSQLPVLSDAWIKEEKANIDRTLAVTSAVSNQFIADIYVKNTSVRPMPLYSVPGLIDHH